MGGLPQEPQNSLPLKIDMGGVPQQPQNSLPSRPFDPEGSDYDYETALSYGMEPTGDGTEKNKGHWGSVAPTSDSAREKYNLPYDSYVVLKGRSHESFSEAVAGEEARGFVVKKYGDRYYSVPKTTPPMYIW